MAVVEFCRGDFPESVHQIDAVIVDRLSMRLEGSQ